MADRGNVWLSAAAQLLVWAVLALGSLAAPWFVVFAVAGWLVLPALTLLGAGLAAIAPRARRSASAVARGVGFAVLVELLPSVALVAFAVSRMGDDYF